MEAEAGTKTSVNEVKENLEAKIEAAKVDLPSAVDSVVKPLVEGLAEAEKSLIENVTQSSSSYATQVEGQVEELVSDPWASLKNLGAKTQTSESSAKETEETLPTSDENVGAPPDAAKTGSDKPRSTHKQPFVAVSATTRASWMNCCGLLDLLKRNGQ